MSGTVFDSFLLYMEADMKYKCLIFDLDGTERVKREKKLFKEVFCTFLFTVPQLLSCGRCRKDLLNPARRGTMQAVKRQEKRSPSLSAKDTGKG